MMRTALALAVTLALATPAPAQGGVSCQAFPGGAVTPGKVYELGQALALFDELEMSMAGMEQIGVVYASGSVIVMVRRKGFLCQGSPVPRWMWDKAVRTALGNDV